MGKLWRLLNVFVIVPSSGLNILSYTFFTIGEPYGIGFAFLTHKHFNPSAFSGKLRPFAIVEVRTFDVEIAISTSFNNYKTITPIGCVGIVYSRVIRFYG